MKQTESSNTLDLYWQLLHLLLSRAPGLPVRFNVLFLSLSRQVAYSDQVTGFSLAKPYYSILIIEHSTLYRLKTIGMFLKWVRM